MSVYAYIRNLKKEPRLIIGAIFRDEIIIDFLNIFLCSLEFLMNKYYFYNQKQIFLKISVIIICSK